MEAKYQEDTLVSCSSRNCSNTGPMNIEALEGSQEVDIWQTVLTILNDTAALFAFLLNCLTLIVLYRAKKLVLREYLVHLAVADLIFSSKQVFVYANFNFLKPFTCPAWAFSVGLALFVSMFIMVAIAVSRYYALLQPTRRFVRGACTHNRIILAIWLAGVFFCSPLILLYSWESGFKNIGLYYYCDPVGKGFLGYYQGISVFIITFMIPFMLLSFLFWKIKNYLSQYQVPGTANITRDLAIRLMHVEVVNMLAVVVALFAALWLPPQIFIVLHEICDKYINSLTQSNHIRLHLAFNFMAQAHSCVNPIIYCFMSTNFREELASLMPWIVRFPCFSKIKKNDSERRNFLSRASNERKTVLEECGIGLKSLNGQEKRVGLDQRMGIDLI